MTDDAGNRNNLIEAPSAEETKLEEPVQATEETEESGTNHIQHPQPVARLEALKAAEKVDRSGTSTPEYARTAAEVAESAALVDPPTPEPETIDATAPAAAQEAANTAAEVADTAKDLDNDLVSDLQPDQPVRFVLPSLRTLELTISSGRRAHRDSHTRTRDNCERQRGPSEREP